MSLWAGSCWTCGCILVSWPTLRGLEPEHCLWNSTDPTSGACEIGALPDLGSLEGQGSPPAATQQMGGQFLFLLNLPCPPTPPHQLRAVQESTRLPCGGRRFTPRQNDWNHCSPLPQGTLHTLCLSPFCEVPAPRPACWQGAPWLLGVKNCRRFPSLDRFTEVKEYIY